MAVQYIRCYSQFSGCFVEISAKMVFKIFKEHFPIISLNFPKTPSVYLKNFPKFLKNFPQFFGYFRFTLSSVFFQNSEETIIKLSPQQRKMNRNYSFSIVHVFRNIQKFWEVAKFSWIFLRFLKGIKICKISTNCKIIVSQIFLRFWKFFQLFESSIKFWL